ncbi:MAG TPA: 4'-phosphopantetheinyl transferase superfamily protein [Planctomycetota bacterium]|nr:4'-phosphopantetheinyl transferase superfamily protein [Planctomycetota bacterium]
MDEVALHACFQPAKAAEAQLGARELHVWAVPLHGDPAPFAALLSPAEEHRLERFRFADHRRRYQIGHGALRSILGGYLDQDPTDIEFRHGPRGKPYLAEKGPYFNLSHSGKLALIAFGSVELGIDLEKVRHLESLGEIARRHFSECEFQALEAEQGEARQAAFYRCWTRKEAYIKAIGEGLSMPLDTFDVSVGEVPEFLACRDGREDPRNWSMLDVSPGPEFIAALALRARDHTVRSFRLEMG